jgi:hypothetical protein
VAALVTGVLGDKVKVLAANDESAVHLGGDDGSGQDTATDRDLTDKGALLVDVAALNGGGRGLETQTDVLVPSASVLAGASSLADLLGVLEDVRLLLVSALALDGEFGSHVVGLSTERGSVEESSTLVGDGWSKLSSRQEANLASCLPRGACPAASAVEFCSFRDLPSRLCALRFPLPGLVPFSLALT